MPKVSEEYFENKKRMIADAAYKVCLRKPVLMVNMQDVIEETGLSQGGIYRFYKNLDEILSAMITNLRTSYNIIDKIETATSDSTRGFAEIVHDVCDILGESMELHLGDIQKINFDVGVLAINEPERAGKIMEGAKGRGNFEYIANTTMPGLIKAAQANNLTPKASPEDIVNFISASYSGIEMNCILSACYRSGPMKMDCRPRELFNILATSIICLFGGEDK